MASPEHMKSFAKRDVEEDAEVIIDKRNDDDWDGDDKRKHKSSKSRKMASGEEVDGVDASGRKRSTSDRHESRKKMSNSSRVDSDQDEYERKESHSKQMKKKSDEHAFYRSSSWYQDEEADHKLEGGDKAASRGYSRDEESDRKKSNSKYSEHDFEANKAPIMDSRYSERRDGNKEKGHGYGEHGRRSQRRWDESETLGKEEKCIEKIDIKSVRSSFSKQESESNILEIESSDGKIKAVDIANDEGIGFPDGEDSSRLELERSQKVKPEVLDEDTKGSSAREDRSGKDRFEEHRRQRNRASRDIAYDNERSLNEEDTNMWMRDKYKRDIESPNLSRTPEKIGRQQYDSENFEMDYERNNSVKRKDVVKDGSWDEKSKVRDDTWVEKDKNRHNFKDIPKRRQEKETRGGETTYDNIRDWELPRRGREWIDGEWSHGRPGGRKDGNRSVAVKTSSNYGISNENYDVIEINTKPFDYGRDDSSSTFVRNSEVLQQSDAKPVIDVDEALYSRDERLRKEHGSGQSGEESKDRYLEGGLAVQDQNSWRDDDFQTERPRSQRGVMSNRGAGGQSSNSGSLPSHGNHENGYFNRNSSQGFRGNKIGRGGRGRFNGRDCQQSGIPLPLVGSPFGPPGIPPPGTMQSLTPNISPAPGLSVSPGVFIPPFQPPIMCPGARGVEMNMLVVQPGLPPVPPGPLAHRFPPNMVNPPNSAMMFNPMGPVRGTPPSMSGPNFNVPAVRGQLQDKASGGWVPPRSNGPPGKAPSRGEQNDYSQNFVDTGMRPQNFIRELELTSVVEDYPKLRDLIQRKDEIVSKSASPPMYFKCDLREQVLSQEFFGTKFDVILVDPPWEEYVHRAPGVTEHMEYWTLEEIMNLKIEAITDTPSFIFLWVGDGVGLEQGRQCLKKWGFRRCEDICWVKTNKTNATPGLRHDSHTLFQRSKEHCLMGIKGTVRRSTDGHIIHANIDTDVIIAEEPPYGSTAKPEDMYRIIEHFSLGRRRLELFGEDHNIRSGWLTVGNGLSSSNFNSEAYVRNFSDKDGKVWVGIGGRNPPPEAPHLIQTTPEIESLRPKSPMKNQQQQQQSVSISLTTTNTSGKRPAGNSPQSHTANQEVYSSNVPSPAPWASPAEPFRGRESSHVASDEPTYDMYGYNPSYVMGNGDGLDISSQGGMNMMM